jgi:hypothetical protein
MLKVTRQFQVGGTAKINTEKSLKQAKYWP